MPELRMSSESISQDDQNHLTMSYERAGISLLSFAEANEGALIPGERVAPVLAVDGSIYCSAKGSFEEISQKRILITYTSPQQVMQTIAQLLTTLLDEDSMETVLTAIDTFARNTDGQDTVLAKEAAKDGLVGGYGLSLPSIEEVGVDDPEQAAAIARKAMEYGAKLLEERMANGETEISGRDLVELSRKAIEMAKKDLEEQ